MCRLGGGTSRQKHRSPFTTNPLDSPLVLLFAAALIVLYGYFCFHLRRRASHSPTVATRARVYWSGLVPLLKAFSAENFSGEVRRSYEISTMPLSCGAWKIKGWAAFLGVNRRY